MKKNTKFFLLLFFIGFFLLLGNFSLAFELSYPPIFGLTINDTTTFPEYARYFFSFGIAISTALATLIIIFGGIYYLVDYGRGKFASEGKDWIKSGITGLFIIFCAYLIVYTINPDLAIFRLNGLKPVIVENPIPEVFTFNAPRVYYNEIPIGTLTENTLSRTIDCYDFDYNGDPISAVMQTDSGEFVEGPTLRNHDRADCVAKLAEAAANKTRLIKDLSDKISSLMKQCKCDTATDDKGNKVCDQTCDKNKSCDTYSGACPAPKNPFTGEILNEENLCSGSCKKAACKFSDNTTANNCCPLDSGVQDPSNPKKNLSVKDLIEYGPISLSSDGCGEDIKKYKGLEEFRHLRSNISGIIETREVKSGGSSIKIINQEAWNQLKLTEQLIYFQEKIDEMKSKIKNDLDNLSKAKNELNHCYFATSYIDFLKLYEQTNPNEKVIMKNKTYTDQTTNQKVDISKYCNGFSYGDSACFNTCQNLCPGDPQQDLACYKKCPKCNYNDSECLQKQAKCMEENCYNKRQCASNANYGNFEGCIAYCKGQCSENCAKKFPSCSEAFTQCKQKCGDDSKCLLNNESKCVFNSPALKNCADKTDNHYYLKKCVDSSYLCKYGSYQNAGYPDCLWPPYSNGKNYSASFIFKQVLKGNQDIQVCPEPYAPYEKGSYTACVDIYPETAKCPSSSNCPECPCGIVSETISSGKNSGGGSSGGSGGSGGGGGGGGSGGTGTGPCPGGTPMKTCPNGTVSCYCLPSYIPNIFKFLKAPTALAATAYNVVVGRCSEFSYNDDPLTFYCEQSWWDNPAEKKPKPIGNERFCSEKNEIPVGMTVDNTEKWANAFIKQLEEISKDIGDTVDYIKKIGNENPQSYCGCDSVCESGKPCSTDCKYTEAKSKDANGKETISCSCSFQPCQGISCQKMINLLDGGKTDNCPVEKDGIGSYYDKIDKSSKSLYIYLIAETRSDILKQLTYSRTKTNECSLIKNQNGDQAKLLSCKRAQDEIIPPIGDGKVIINGKTIKAYCYGQNLKNIGISNIMDNWFCCEKR